MKAQTQSRADADAATIARMAHALVRGAAWRDERGAITYLMHIGGYDARDIALLVPQARIAAFHIAVGRHKAGQARRA